MSAKFLTHHGFRYSGDHRDHQDGSFKESVFYEMLVNFLLFVFFLVLFIVL